MNHYINERKQNQQASDTQELRYQTQITKLTQALQQREIEGLAMAEEMENRKVEMEEMTREMSKKQEEIERLENEMREKERQIEEMRTEVCEKQQEVEKWMEISRDMNQSDEKETDVHNEIQNEREPPVESSIPYSFSEPSHIYSVPIDPATNPLHSLSTPLPSSSSLEVYQLVISQLYRDVLELQRENRSLSEQLAASQPIAITLEPPVESESTVGAWEMVSRMQESLQALQTMLHEKNQIIYNQNLQLQQLLAGSPYDFQPSGEQVENHIEEFNSTEQPSQGNSIREEFVDESLMSDEKLPSDEHSSKEFTDSQVTSNPQLSDEHIPVESSHEQELLSEIESLRDHCSSLQTKNDQLQSQLSISRGNIHQLADLYKIRLANFQNDLLSVRETLLSQQAELQKDVQSTIRTIGAKYALIANHLLSSRQLISSLRDEIQNYKGNYRVMIRVRPINQSDASDEFCMQIRDEYNMSIYSRTDKNGPKSFVFDRILPPAASQEEVFQEVEPAVLSIFRGVNATILAYGQTGAGKTYSMIGRTGRLGIIPRSCAILFEELKYRQEMHYQLKVETENQIKSRLVYARCIVKQCVIC